MRWVTIFELHFVSWRRPDRPSREQGNNPRKRSLTAPSFRACSLSELSSSIFKRTSLHGNRSLLNLGAGGFPEGGQGGYENAERHSVPDREEWLGRRRRGRGRGRGHRDRRRRGFGERGGIHSY